MKDNIKVALFAFGIVFGGIAAFIILIAVLVSIRG